MGSVWWRGGGGGGGGEDIHDEWKGTVHVCTVGSGDMCSHTYMYNTHGPCGLRSSHTYLPIYMYLILKQCHH